MVFGFYRDAQENLIVCAPLCTHESAVEFPHSLPLPIAKEQHLPPLARRKHTLELADPPQTHDPSLGTETVIIIRVGCGGQGDAGIPTACSEIGIGKNTRTP